MTAPVWIHFPGLPIELMFPRILLEITASIGTQLKVDAITSSGARAIFARVCIILDFSQSLPKRTWVRIGDVDFCPLVAYENIPNLCFSCRIVGHKMDQCLQSKP